MSVVIRELQQSDHDQVRKVILAGLAERWGSEFDPSYNKDLDDIYGYYVNRHQATVAVIEEKQQDGLPIIIGCGILIPLPAEDVYGTWCAEPDSVRAVAEGLKLGRMMRLSVSEKYRGRGLAKKMIRHLLQKAREQQFEMVVVETETAWTSAVQIYKSEGFTVVEANEENIHSVYRL
ncbi:hypothetical protein FBU30_004910 [Linnemannia zychae]|nr:hypothetical protein FBU30_004910 [Linnemannia zychae]